MPKGIWKTRPRKPLIEAHKLAVSESLKGRIFSDEHRRKLSVVARNRPPITEAHKQKIREANSGKASQRTGGGYIYIYQPNHPRANQEGYVKRANLVVEKAIGRFLLPREEINHRNGIKDDDRLENLQLFATKSEHMKFHYQNGDIHILQPDERTGRRKVQCA